jgi:Tol biopolymer transport system component
VTTGSNVIGGPAAAPDGAHLAFAQTGGPSGPGSDTQVVLDALTTKALTVFSAQGDAEPAFARDGSRIAMTTTRYGSTNPEIVLVDRDGGSPFRLTTSPGVDGEAAFQR